MPEIAEDPTFDEAAFNRALGSKIAAHRSAMGMRQVDLAIAMDTSTKTVGAVERGQYPLGINLLQRFADALGVTAVSLLRADEADGAT